MSCEPELIVEDVEDEDEVKLSLLMIKCQQMGFDEDSFAQANDIKKAFGVSHQDITDWFGDGIDLDTIQKCLEIKENFNGFYSIPIINFFYQQAHAAGLSSDLEDYEIDPAEPEVAIFEMFSDIVRQPNMSELGLFRFITHNYNDNVLQAYKDMYDDREAFQEQLDNYTELVPV